MRKSGRSPCNRRVSNGCAPPHTPPPLTVVAHRLLPGFPRPQTYVMNLTAIAMGEPAIKDFITYINFTTMADGLVGGAWVWVGECGWVGGWVGECTPVTWPVEYAIAGVNPNVIFYFPIIKQNFSAFKGSRYWTMIASPVPDMEGGREQSVWFRFQQLACAGEADDFKPPCALHGAPQYYDTYWYSGSPANITNRWIRPEKIPG